MVIIPFKEANMVFKADGCYDLPALRVQYISGETSVTACWKPSWFERLALLFGSNIYCTLICKNPQPQLLTVGQPDFFQDLQHD